MKGLFLDAVDDLASVFRHVSRPGDPPMTVHRAWRDQARRIARVFSPDTISCFDDHTPDADRGDARLHQPEAHHLSGHRRSQLHAPRGTFRHRHHRPHHQRLRRHGGGGAYHRPDVGGGPRSGADGRRHARRQLDPHRGHGTHRQDDRSARFWRHRGRGGSDRRRVRDARAGLEPLVQDPRRG